MNFSRRSLLSAGAALAATPAAAKVTANGADQTSELQAAIDRAAEKGGVLRLGAGKFHVSGLRLTTSLQIEGVAGHTRLVALGKVDILSVEGAEHLSLSGVTFEGGGNGLVLKNCGGRISGNEFLLQEKTALFALDSKGLEISGNHVHDIGNNGIQVWTTDKREDGTLVINNRRGAHRRESWRLRPEWQWHQHLQGGPGPGCKQPHIGLLFFRHPQQRGLQLPDHGQQHFTHRRSGDLCGVRL